MPRPISATIHVGALRANLARVRQSAAGRFIWAVVKANAYGHGVERAVRAFAAADGLALLDLDEAVRARAAGWTKPILLLEGFFESGDLDLVQTLGLHTAVHCEEQLRALELARLTRPITVYLKLNTGMNRLGFRREAVARVRQRLDAIEAVRVAGLMTHFANAERIDPAAGPVAVLDQLAQLAEVERRAEDRDCLANSAALLFQPQAGGAAVRAGIALYGSSPDARASRDALGLAAGMTLSSRILAVQDVAVGGAVGYGSRFVARRPTRIGVVACGYADGYPRHAADGTPVLVDGLRVPLAGRVSMDMITVDLTEHPAAGVGSPVELWGEHLSIDEVAASADTVAYELMCALAPRVSVAEVE